MPRLSLGVESATARLARCADVGGFGPLRTGAVAGPKLVLGSAPVRLFTAHSVRPLSGAAV